MRWGIVLIVVAVIGAGAGALWWKTSAPVKAVAGGPAATLPAHDPAELRVTLCNIRYSNSRDGENDWAKRRDFLVAVLKADGPDVLALQEVTGVQRRDLAEKLGDQYAFYPDGRDEKSVMDAMSNLNMTLIVYRKDRFEVVAWSNGPVRENVGANPETTAYFSLAVLKDNLEKLPELIVANTHLRHQIKEAATDAQMLNNRITAEMRLRPKAQVLLLGDMNFDKTTPAAAPVYQSLKGEEAPFPAKTARTELRDTYDYASKKAGEKWGTYHNFTGKAGAEWPTDLIFVSEGLQATPAEIVRESKDGKWPSDHFPIRVRVKAK